MVPFRSRHFEGFSSIIALGTSIKVIASRDFPVKLRESSFLSACTLKTAAHYRNGVAIVEKVRKIRLQTTKVRKMAYLLINRLSTLRYLYRQFWLSNTAVFCHHKVINWNQPYSLSPLLYFVVFSFTTPKRTVCAALRVHHRKNAFSSKLKHFILCRFNCYPSHAQI